jgi:hypothetical protein
MKLGTAVHTYNLSYLEGRRRGISSLRPHLKQDKGLKNTLSDFDSAFPYENNN